MIVQETQNWDVYIFEGDIFVEIDIGAGAFKKLKKVRSGVT